VRLSTASRMTSPLAPVIAPAPRRRSSADEEMPKRQRCSVRTMHTLLDAASGKYWLTTWSGTRYLIDLDNESLTRFPFKVHTVPDVALWLRSDHAPIALLHIAECTVGRPGRFVVDLGLADVSFTIRTTTTVQAIESTLTGGKVGGGES
jgi:hypothetical protein